MRRIYIISIVLSIILSSCEDSETVEAPESYTTKVLIEYLKGTWCGFSARVDYTLEQVESNNKNIIGVEVHYSDKLGTRYAPIMRSEYLIKSFPTGLLNRSVFWNESQDQLDTYLNEISKLGLAISSAIEGNSIKVDVKIGFAEDIVKDLKLVVYITEDGILENQANVYNDDVNSPLFNAGNPIIDYEHNDVLRVALTDFLGEDIPKASVFERNIYNRDFEVEVSEYNINNMNVVAFVIDAADSRNVYNAQTVKAGSSIDFD